MTYKKEDITSIGELNTQKGGKHLTPIFKGSQFPIFVYVTKAEFEATGGIKELMIDLAISKINKEHGTVAEAKFPPESC